MIAITGGIGTGKSYVCHLLRERGIDVYDCDLAAKRLMRESRQIRTSLTALIGPEAYVGDSLNKPVVAQFLLASDENNKAINFIVHPAVAEDFKLSGYEWMECAILYESGFNALADRVVAVSAPYDVRLQRIVKRDNISPEKAAEWIARQLPQEEIDLRADYVISNDGCQDLEEQIDNLLMNIYDNNFGNSR